MRPPICAICGKDFGDAGISGDWVSFELTDEEKKYNKKFKEPGFVGHPAGLEWFCDDHLQGAEEYSFLTLKEALPHIQTYEPISIIEPKIPPKSTSWLDRIKSFFRKK